MPPDSPLPNPIEFPQFYGETYVRYPLSQTRLPTYHGLLFKAKADLWVIINEYSIAQHGCYREPQKLSVEQILGFYNRMTNWLHNLPGPLTPQRIVMPHQIKLHMHYNLILVAMLKPIVKYDWGNRGQPGKVFPVKTPREAYLDATIFFESTVRIYYLRHGFNALDNFLIHFLGSLSQLTVNAINENEGSAIVEPLRSTLLLCLKGIQDQSRSYYIGKGVLRLQVSLMRAQDVELLKRFVMIETDDVIFGPLEQPIQSDWPAYALTVESSGHQTQYISLSRQLASLSFESPVAMGPSPRPSGSPS